MVKNTKTKDVEVAKKLINIYQSAQDRKIEFDLSFEYVKKLLEYKTCYYTGIEFTEDGVYARSFDRVDSDKGYIEGNVVACTIDINGKKANLYFEEIELIYNKILIHKNKHKQIKEVEKYEALSFEKEPVLTKDLPKKKTRKVAKKVIVENTEN